MTGLRIGALFFLGLASALCCFAGNREIFHLIDVNSSDYKITDLAIEYSDATVADGFRIQKDGQARLIPWSAITNLKLETTDQDVSDGFLKCSVKFTDGKTLISSCVNGTLLGTTRNGDYRMPLGKVIELKAVRLSGFSLPARMMAIPYSVPAP